MVSRRSLQQNFTEGERVLCYEPDPTKAKVLYDSKVLGILESRDRRGKKIIQYKVHFQGWNSSWDRRVNADFVLKDTAENRQLQRDLADKAQLQLAAYLYRRERKKRGHKNISNGGSIKIRNRILSDDGSSCSTYDRNYVDYQMQEDCDTDSYSSSIDSMLDEERVFLKIGEKLKQYLYEDYEMISKKKKLHELPVKINVVHILENFVKQNALKLITESHENSRRRTSNLRSEKREKDLEKLSNTISLLKEIADGLRLYFDFTLQDFLIYKEEREQVNSVLSNEKNGHKTSLKCTCDFFTKNGDYLLNLSRLSNWEESHNSINYLTTSSEEISKRKLRSHRNDNNDGFDTDLCVSNLRTNYSTIFEDMFITTSTSSNRTVEASNFGFVNNAKKILENILSWKMIPLTVMGEPATIFGATHFARLLVKLPEFLNAINMSNDKMDILLHHLNSCILYLEAHDEYFGIHNYREE